MIMSTVRYPFFVLLICIMAVIFAPGCGGPIMLNRKSVDNIGLMTQQVTANLDGVPGPDGLQVKVYLYHEYKTIPARGTLEIMLFDGNEARVLRAHLERWRRYHAADHRTHKTHALLEIGMMIDGRLVSHQLGKVGSSVLHVFANDEIER